MSIELRLAVTHDDKESIFRLRYEIYVKELGYSQPFADHTRQRIVEPMDRTATLLGAFDGSRIIGTLRTAYARACSLGIYEDLYSLSRARPFHPERTSITTKLMVAKEHRGSSLAVALASEAYRLGRSDGIEFDFIDCKSQYVQFFESLGYRRFKRPVVHPEYGEVLPLVLCASDIGHLRSAGSPFAALCERFPASGEAVAFWRDSLGVQPAAA